MPSPYIWYDNIVSKFPHVKESVENKSREDYTQAEWHKQNAYLHQRDKHSSESDMKCMEKLT